VNGVRPGCAPLAIGRRSHWKNGGVTISNHVHDKEKKEK
jgi:hypothetical protein